MASDAASDSDYVPPRTRKSTRKPRETSPNKNAGMARLHSLLTKRKAPISDSPSPSKYQTRRTRARIAETPSRSQMTFKPSNNLKFAETRAMAQAKYYKKATQIMSQRDEDFDVFPFLALPPELRLAVYFELLVTDDRLVPTWRGPRKANKQQKKMYINVLLTCKLCRDEGVTVLYGENVFDFGEICNRPNNFCKPFVNYIGPTNASLIRIIIAEYSAAAEELSRLDISLLKKPGSPYFPAPITTLTVANMRRFLSTFNITPSALRVLAISIIPYGFDQASVDLMRIQASGVTREMHLRVKWLDAKNEGSRLAQLVDEICAREEELGKANYWEDIDAWIGLPWSPPSSGREWIVYKGVRGKGEQEVKAKRRVGGRKLG